MSTDVLLCGGKSDLDRVAGLGVLARAWQCANLEPWIVLYYLCWNQALPLRVGGFQVSGVLAVQSG